LAFDRVLRAMPDGALEPAPRPSVGEPPTSFFRAWMLVPLVVLVLAVAAVAAGIMLGRLELGGPFGVQPRSSPTADPELRPIAIRGVSAFDPEGDGSEHDELAELAADGDPETEWYTERYEQADLGGLKSGVGLLLDLGTRAPLAEIVIRTPSGGWTFELRTSDDGAIAGEPLPDQEGRTSHVAGTRTVVGLDGAEVRYLVLWITDLPPAPDGGYRAFIQEVEVRGG
jgi:serine/threonine kinase PknH